MSTHLPIHDVIPEVRAKFREHDILILHAPPGAGKSTVLPLELLNEPWLGDKKIVMLEPRRLAARSVSARMAASLQEETGETVGYSIRFERKVSAKTKLVVVTEGLLARRMQQDETLNDVGLLIFDEFHERNLHADFALTLALEIRNIVRPDLKILIMSATLDTAALSALLGNAPVVSSEGRQFPITLNYTAENAARPLHANVTELVTRALTETKGDILVFLPGAGEIKRTQDELEARATGCMIHPLYGDLSFAEQEEALQPNRHGLRKIVLSTSIAETSLTIEGISTVVDCGYSRVPRFDPETGLDKLVTIRVTKDTADQRAGRAGRLGPGQCYRLWTETIQLHLQPSRRAEILDADLSPLLLNLFKWGYADVHSLTWITAPPVPAVEQAKQLLEALGAIENHRITAHGKELLALPAHPRIAHMLLEGKKTQQAELACDIAALLDERDPMGNHHGSDLSLRCEELAKYRRKERVNGDRFRYERIEHLAKYWRNVLGAKNTGARFNPFVVGSLLAAAYPERIAFRQSGTQYRLANGRKANLPEHDPLTHEEWIVAAHLHLTQQGAKIFMAAPLDKEDVQHLAKEKIRVVWDSASGELIARKEKCIGDIVTGFKQIQNIPDEELIPILLEAVKQDGESLLDWNDEAVQLQRRIALLHSCFPESNWPDFSREHLLESPETWLAPYLTARIRRKGDFQKLNLVEILTALLSWEQQQELEKLAPSKLEVPSGSWIKIEYQEHQAPPILPVRLQELFGMADTPVIARGKIKLMIHLLSPAYRPVQVTQDLRSFWNTTYAEVRKELRARYLKHSWPEDPWTAVAVRGVKKRFK
ncbi:MAG TPA: ATP-dependent helicase HrpB [Bacteroidia bacterium]|nr:ATP-dependent helicase HrpB [Bacteroidia bacterium]